MTRNWEYYPFFWKLLIIGGICLYLILPLGVATTGDGNSPTPIITGTAEGLEDIKAQVLDEILGPFTNREWGNPTVDMIIITPNRSDFIQAAEIFAQWKTDRGIPTQVVSNFTQYSGVDTQEKIRSVIQSYYDTYGIEWVLLLGDAQEDFIPIRYIRNPDTTLVSNTNELGGLPGGNYDKPTDFYYAELTGDWNQDGDAYWGENAEGNDVADTPEMDYIPEVYVGRFPVDSINEVYTVLNKTMNYESGVAAGTWMNEYLGISGISDSTGTIGDMDGEDEARLGQYVIDNYINESMEWEHALEHTSAYTPLDDPRVINLNSYSVTDKVNEGVSVILYAGHGSDSRFATRSTSITTSTLDNWNNGNKLPLLYASACSTNCYDVDYCLGEKAILQEDAGVIGYIGSTRVSWYYPNDTALERDNRGMTKIFFEEMFQNNNFQQGKALYEAKKAYVASDWFQFTEYQKNDEENPFLYFEMERKTITSYMLLGDPSVDIYTDIPVSASLDIPESYTIYQNSSMRISVNNSNGNAVPFARVIVSAENGGYEVFIADQNGIVEIITPNTNSFNYTVFGHNIAEGEEQTVFLSTDGTSPEIITLDTDESSQVVMNKDWIGNFRLLDNESGPLNAYFIICPSDFSSFKVYQMKAESTVVNVETLDLSQTLQFNAPGTHKYFILGTDGAHHYVFGLDSEPLGNIKVLLPISIRLIQWGVSISIVALVGVVVWKLIRFQPQK